MNSNSQNITSSQDASPSQEVTPSKSESFDQSMHQLDRSDAVNLAQ